MADNTALSDYRTVLAILEDAVAHLAASDLERPTPCAEWTLGGVVTHAVGAMGYYAALARDGHATAGGFTVTFRPGDDVAQRVGDAADAAVTAWSAPGALDRQVDVLLGAMTGRDALAIHTADLAVHTWDISVARATRVSIPADVATRALDTWIRVFGARDLRGRHFAAAVPVAPDASPTAQLVAYSGRDPRAMTEPPRPA